MPQLQDMFKGEGWAEYVRQLTSTLPHDPARAMSMSSTQLPPRAQSGQGYSTISRHLQLLPDLSVVSW